VRKVWFLTEVEVEVGLVSLWGGVVEFFTAAGKEKVREETETGRRKFSVAVKKRER
jgi:hypothetical protein